MLRPWSLLGWVGCGSPDGVSVSKLPSVLDDLMENMGAGKGPQGSGGGGIDVQEIVPPSWVALTVIPQRNS